AGASTGPRRRRRRGRRPPGSTPRTRGPPPSVDRIRARFAEPPSLAPPGAPFLPPGTARTTSVSPEFLPERSVGPEAWARPQHARRTSPRRPPRPGALRSRAPMVVVVPREEAVTVLPSVLDRAEPRRKRWAGLQRLEVRFRERIVVRDGATERVCESKGGHWGKNPTGYGRSTVAR